MLWITRQAHQRTLNHALIEAIKRKNTVQAIQLLNAGANASARDEPYKPITLKSACTDLWRRFRGTEPAKDTNYYPPAILLIYPQDWDYHYITDETLVDNAELVQALLAHGADPNAKTKWGDTLLFLAVRKNHIKIASVLLEHHVNPNVRSIDTLTPLMWTASGCARLLIEHGADVNARDKSQETPLMWTWSCKTCQILLDHGADINAQDWNGQTALMRDIKDYNSSLGKAKIHAKIHWLLKHGARVNIRDKSGKTALQYAHASPDLPPKAKQELISLLEEAAKKQRVP